MKKISNQRAFFNWIWKLEGLDVNRKGTGVKAIRCFSVNWLFYMVNRGGGTRYVKHIFLHT